MNMVTDKEQLKTIWTLFATLCITHYGNFTAQFCTWQVP